MGKVSNLNGKSVRYGTFRRWFGSFVAIGLCTMNSVGANDSVDAVKHWGTTVAGFRAFVALPKQAYAPTEAVIVSVGIKNDSKQPLILVSTDPRTDWDLQVWNDAGALVANTAYGRALQALGEDRLRRVTINLGADEVDIAQFNINRRFDITLPGTYRVMVKRQVLATDGGGLAMVESGVASFRVVE